MDYKQKYLKYKNKYTGLKNRQKGGGEFLFNFDTYGDYNMQIMKETKVSATESKGEFLTPKKYRLLSVGNIILYQDKSIGRKKTGKTHTKN